MKFTNFEQVEKEFKNRSMGSNRIPSSYVTYSDISEQREGIEYLLDTDYNKFSGFTFMEMMEAVSTLVFNNTSAYINDNKLKHGVVNESFLGTTQAMTQFPVLSKGVVLYQYEKSVLPYLAHVFDLKGNRGLIHYMELVASKAQGDVNVGDLIASPKELPKQTTNFMTTKMNKIVATLQSGVDTYTLYLGGAPSTPISVQPQSLEIYIDGPEGYLKDDSNEKESAEVTLSNHDGKIGCATLNRETGVVELVLDVAPSQSGGKIRAIFNRDVQTREGGLTNQGKVMPRLAFAQLEAEDISLETEVNLHQQRLAQVLFGLDWDKEVDELLGMCYNREIANRVLKDIVEKIPADSVQTYDIASTIPSGADNRFFNINVLPTAILSIPKNISKASGLTGINKVSSYCVNVDAIPLLQSSGKFKAVETGENFMGGMALVGVYDNTPVIQAYESILSGETNGAEIVGIYKSKEKEFLTAAVVGQFILPIIREVYSQDNQAINLKTLIASAGIKTVVPQLAAKLVINGITNLF